MVYVQIRILLKNETYKILRDFEIQMDPSQKIKPSVNKQ